MFFYQPAKQYTWLGLEETNNDYGYNINCNHHPTPSMNHLAPDNIPVTPSTRTNNPLNPHNSHNRNHPSHLSHFGHHRHPTNVSTSNVNHFLSHTRRPSIFSIAAGTLSPAPPDPNDSSNTLGAGHGVGGANAGGGSGKSILRSIGNLFTTHMSSHGAMLRNTSISRIRKASSQNFNENMIENSTPRDPNQDEFGLRWKLGDTEEDEILEEYERRHRICAFYDLPPWYSGYPSVLHGYRLNYTIKQAFWSSFTKHNETCNIWTEWFPALILIGLLIYWSLLDNSFVRNQNLWTNIIVLISCSVFCLRPIVSGFAHTLHCANEQQRFVLFFVFLFVFFFFFFPLKVEIGVHRRLCPLR